MIFLPEQKLLKLISTKFSDLEAKIFNFMTRAGIQEPRSPGTDRSESVPDNKNSVGPGSVLDFEDFLGPGPEPKQKNFQKVELLGFLRN